MRKSGTNARLMPSVTSQRAGFQNNTQIMCKSWPFAISCKSPTEGDQPQLILNTGGDCFGFCFLPQVLYVPRHWWHYVESVDPVTVSVNSWIELVGLPPLHSRLSAEPLSFSAGNEKASARHNQGDTQGFPLAFLCSWLT